MNFYTVKSRNMQEDEAAKPNFDPNRTIPQYINEVAAPWVKDTLALAIASGEPVVQIPKCHFDDIVAINQGRLQHENDHDKYNLMLKYYLRLRKAQYESGVIHRAYAVPQQPVQDAKTDNLTKSELKRQRMREKYFELRRMHAGEEYVKKHEIGWKQLQKKVLVIKYVHTCPYVPKQKLKKWAKKKNKKNKHNPGQPEESELVHDSKDSKTVGLN